MTRELAARTRLQMVFAFAAVYLVWGSTYLGIAFAIQSIPPLLMAGARFLLAGSLLYAWARVRGAAAPRPIQWGWALFLGALFFLIGNGAVVWVEQHLSSALTALIIAMVPVWTALLEWVGPRGSRPPGVVLLGILLGFLGVAILVMPNDSGGQHVDLAGVLLLMAASFGWALASVLNRMADMPSNTRQVSGMEMLAGGGLLLLGSLIAGEWGRFDPSAITLKSGLAFLYLVVFGSLVTFTAYAWLLKVSTPSKVATAGYVNPMVAVFLGWAFGGESFTARAALASVVIVSSVVLIITGRGFAMSRIAPPREEGSPNPATPGLSLGRQPSER